MTVRSIALALTGAATFAAAAAIASASPAQAGATADAWRYKGYYPTLVACQNAGRAYIAAHQARAYKCENDYTTDGVPVLDLYIR